MNDKEEIRQYLDAQLNTSEEDIEQLIRDDFEHLLNSAESCVLITVEGAMPALVEQLRTELRPLRIETDLDIVVNVSYHPTSEISFDHLCDLLSVIREFVPKVNILWGCGTDKNLADTDYSMLLLIGTEDSAT